MCAGNTREEALVQGFAEILERVVHKRILVEKPVLPDIPEACMQKYPEVYEKYLFLRKNSNYDVIMKDCSLGGKFPVAGLVIIEKNTGTYGIKLGCHPDYGMLLTDRYLKKLPDPVVIAVSVIAFLLLLSGMILLRKH